MAKSKQQKVQTKDKLSELFKASKSAAFADYQGLTVAKADVLRKSARAEGVTYIVAKKSLINIAAKEAGIEMDAKNFPGMIGIAFSNKDEVTAAKILGDMGRSTPLKLVGGVIGGKVVDQAYIMALSKLPSRTQLYGMFLSTINGPVSGFVRALDAIRKQKEATA